MTFNLTPDFGMLFAIFHIFALKIIKTVFPVLVNVSIYILYGSSAGCKSKFKKGVKPIIPIRPLIGLGNL